MRLAIFIALLTLLTNMMHAQDLSSYRWKKRVVILFAGEAMERQQSALAKDRSGLEERDVEIVPVSADEKALHKKYQVKSGAFALILVGKDGGEKYRSETVVGVETLFAQIDAMPMRREEASGNKKLE